MRASDLLRDLLATGDPATAATSATTGASTTFPGLRHAATSCDTAGKLSQMSQAVANAESKQPCGLSQDSPLSQGGAIRNPDAPCTACGCGSFWQLAGAWYCEQCTDAPPGITGWRTVSGGTVAPIPSPAVPWPPELTDTLRRVAERYEWSRADIADFCRWARRSPEAMADAAENLRGWAKAVRT